jgi:hypothetical protein
MSDGFTLTLTGMGLWEKRATDAEAMRMAIYVKMAEARGVQGRCDTCAFRSGTDANGSSLVVRCIDLSLQSGGTFGCHTVERECAGFTAIKNEFCVP